MRSVSVARRVCPVLRGCPALDASVIDCARNLISELALRSRPHQSNAPARSVPSVRPSKKKALPADGDHPSESWSYRKEVNSKRDVRGGSGDSQGPIAIAHTAHRTSWRAGQNTKTNVTRQWAHGRPSQFSARPQITLKKGTK